MKNYTSTVPAERSVAEIEGLLIRAGARSISKEYSNGEVSALNFVKVTIYLAHRDLRLLTAQGDAGFMGIR